MHLSNRDIKWAIECGRLIIEPGPMQIDETSVDLHLDGVEKARVWNTYKFSGDNLACGREALELRTSQIDYKQFSKLYHIPVSTDENKLVFRRHNQIIVKPGGFLLWQTREWVGTPEENPDLICFVDGKSTRARTGLLVHLTAPTIHAGWAGNITLEIANLGPFHLVLQEFDDVIAQLTVSTISSTPGEIMKRSKTSKQSDVGGGDRSSRKPPKKANEKT